MESKQGIPITFFPHYSPAPTYNVPSDAFPDPLGGELVIRHAQVPKRVLSAHLMVIPLRGVTRGRVIRPDFARLRGLPHNSGLDAQVPSTMFSARRHRPVETCHWARTRLPSHRFWSVFPRPSLRWQGIKPPNRNPQPSQKVRPSGWRRFHSLTAVSGRRVSRPGY